MILISIVVWRQLQINQKFDEKVVVELYLRRPF